MIIAGAAVILASCGKREANLPRSAARDPLLVAAEPALAEWTAMWRAAFPAFTLDSLERTGTERPFHVDLVQPLKDAKVLLEANAPASDVLSAPSPDGRYQLVFDAYQAIVEEEGRIEIGGEADSAPLLLDLERDLSHRLEFCGTPCRFEWGAWITPVSFALGGSEEAEREGASQRGRLQIYSLADSTKVTFVTRALTAQEYGRYRAAWESWVISRYRAIKRIAQDGTSASSSSSRE